MQIYPVRSFRFPIPLSCRVIWNLTFSAYYIWSITQVAMTSIPYNLILKWRFCRHRRKEVFTSHRKGGFKGQSVVRATGRRALSSIKLYQKGSRLHWSSCAKMVGMDLQNHSPWTMSYMWTSPKFSCQHQSNIIHMKIKYINSWSATWIIRLTKKANKSCIISKFWLAHI
jgi:hypothetical protein